MFVHNGSKQRYCIAFGIFIQQSDTQQADRASRSRVSVFHSSSSMAQGLRLVEFHHIIYKGHKELSPHEQIGTIKVSDEKCEHYLYKVDKVDTSKPSIQHLDEIVLTGPTNSSISADGSITIAVDLFDGAYKETFEYDDFCFGQIEYGDPVRRRIVSKDGRGEILMMYAAFDNAVEAHLEFKLLMDDGCSTKMFGVVAALTSTIDEPEFPSILFLKRADDKIELESDQLLPLSRSIVAVPLESELFLDIHLFTEDAQDICQDTIKFCTKGVGSSKEVAVGRNCKIQVQVTWKAK